MVLTDDMASTYTLINDCSPSAARVHGQQVQGDDVAA